MRWLLGISALLVLACGRGVKLDDDPVDSDPPSDTDADADADTDTDTDGDTDILSPGDPSLDASFSGTQWVTAEGHWLPGGTTYLVAFKGDAQLNIELDGDLGQAGSAPVRSVSYYETVHNGYNFYYQLSGGEASLQVEGRDADGDYLWGSLDGPLTLTDIQGTGDVVLESLALESWPRYGAR